jgi:hypothetical protein
MTGMFWKEENIALCVCVCGGGGVPPEYFYSDFNVLVMPGNAAGNIYRKSF